VLRLAQVAADRPSFRTISRQLGSDHKPSGSAVRVRVRPLGGAPVVLRCGTSDPQVLWDTFVGGYHLPMHELSDIDAAFIVDLGANIGLTMADFAVRHPGARVLGVELDAANAELCRLNTAPWASRCSVVQAAVWHEDGEVQYSRAPGDEWGFRVEQERSAGVATVRSISLGTLLGAERDRRPVDYLKMDIEGAEREVLRANTGWASLVRRIGVEVHAPYTVEDGLADLAALGFRPEPDHRHWGSVYGSRSVD
jgi:FkbM family methyltransferase